MDLLDLLVVGFVGFGVAASLVVLVRADLRVLDRVWAFGMLMI